MIKSTGEGNFSSLFLKLRESEGSETESHRKPAKGKQLFPLLLISPSASTKTKGNVMRRRICARSKLKGNMAAGPLAYETK